ncbi:MAG: NAD(P)/FAD-dependent oxidoreductase [Planctomycetes bacterium]|nr:NAD(P)/FAD-dependent oxidoreductase [Planctomycetota bacterium]
MDYDVVIIGAGMSGLAAGIRLAYFDQRVCILERHEVYGGLNSFYTLGGRQFDVGLHAVTNYVGPEVRSAPLPKLLRQLRLSRDEFDLRPQRWSEVRFPGLRLRFSNDVALLTEEVAATFPDQADGFIRLLTAVRAYDDTALDVPTRPTRPVLADFLSDPVLIDMLLCPIMFYGCASEHDMDFTQFVTLFKALYLEGFARPRGGVRVILKALVRKYRSCGGKLRTRCGVRRIETDGDRVTGVTLDSGETVTGQVVLSSAGYVETMRLCGPQHDAPGDDQVGRLSFTESISCLDILPADLGIESAIIFFNDAERFEYARPPDLVDVRSGVICCPNNYQDHEHLTEGLIRLTSMANYDRWTALDEPRYAEAKRDCLRRTIDRAVKFIPEFRDRVVYSDMFTPRTIRHYTGHLGGAVYGTPAKRRDGRTRLKNLYICGTDQGFLGIVGAMLSGISMANLHVLSKV